MPRLLPGAAFRRRSRLHDDQVLVKSADRVGGRRIRRLPLPGPPRAAGPGRIAGGDCGGQGQRFALTSLHGKVALVFFGYTFCPDVCPTTLSKLSAVSRALGDQRDRVRVVYITVDPRCDTPAVLREHLSMFRLDAIGLTGTPEEISRTAHQFGADYSIEVVPSEAGYFVSHTTTLYALDPQGRVRLLLPYEATVDQIVAGVRSILVAR